MKRRVYLVTDGNSSRVFGTLARARAYIESLNDYVKDAVQPESGNSEFWENPDDLDDQMTIYRLPVE